MEGIIKKLQSRLNGVRSSNATPSMIDAIVVDLSDYTSILNTISTISMIDAYNLSISPYAKMYLKPIERAIHKSNLGLNPSINGDVIHVKFPVLTLERREDLVKIAKSYGEDAKVAARQLRKKLNDEVKLYSGSDDRKQAEFGMNQNMINSIISMIDENVSRKCHELRNI